MNSFGRFFRIAIFGESHGTSVGVLIDGCPAGIQLSGNDLTGDLDRRRGGRTGTTGRVENDSPKFLSGTFEGRTTGAPLLIVFDNAEQDSDAYEGLRFTPRPGHADLTAFKKYGGFNDYRGGGHFSGRLTVGIVAAGAIAKKIIKPVTVEARLVEAGGSDDTKKAVREAQAGDDSIGGIVECRANGIPAGLGEPFFDSVESLISHGVFSIPAIVGIEFGAGFAAAAMPGSSYNDAIVDITGKTATNNSGGIVGGITNGNELFFKAAVKPTPSISKPQGTVNLRTGEMASISVRGRHDRCVALRVPVIIEAVCACVLADCMLMQQIVQRVWPRDSQFHHFSDKAAEQDPEILDGRELGRLFYDAMLRVPKAKIFDESMVTQLDDITARLEHLKHIIRGKDDEELRSFFDRAKVFQ